MPSTPAETDPSVCYRHPDRTSWTLCTRCGRTICPECQILTPAGVRCPDCVREEGGSVRWQPAAGPRPGTTAKPKRRGRSRSAELIERVDSSTYPVLTLATAGVTTILWIAGYFTSNLPFSYLAAVPPFAAQVWRYITTSLVYPALGGQAVVGTVLGIAIWVFIAWGAEKQLGRRRFGGLMAVTGPGSAAIAMLAGGFSFGLTGVIWGIAGAYIVSVWNHPPARNRLLISLALWFVISLFLGNIFAVIGGVVAGVGAMLLFRVYDDRPRSAWWVPYLILTAAIAVIVFLAILRTVVLS